MPKRLWMLALLPLILTACGAPASSANATPIDVRLVAGHDNPAIVGSDVVHVPVGGTLTVSPRNGAAQAAAKRGNLELTGATRNAGGVPRISAKPSLSLRFPRPGGYYAYIVVNPHNAKTGHAWGYRRLTILVGLHAKPPKASPWLGVFIATDTIRLAREFDLKTDQGVVVLYVDPHSPAQKAGILAGEVIYLIGNRLVSTTSQLERAIAADAVGQRVVVALVRRWAPETPSTEISKPVRLGSEPPIRVTIPTSATIPLPPPPKPHSTVAFGTGFDKASFSLTGIGSAFSTNTTIHWLLDDPSAFDTTTLGLQLYQIQGATEQLVNTTTVTLDPQSTEEEDTLNQYLAPGTYQLLCITNNTVLASGTFTIR